MPNSATKEALRVLLAEGSRGECGNATTVARAVLDVPDLLSTLIAFLDDGDPAVVAHAAHAAMQVAVDQPELFRDEIDGLICRLCSPAQWEIGEQVPKILAEQALSRAQASRLIVILERRLSDRSAICASSALSALARLGERGLVPAGRVRSAHETALSSPSKALAARARRLRGLVQRLA